MAAFSSIAIHAIVKCDFGAKLQKNLQVDNYRHPSTHPTHLPHPGQVTGKVTTQNVAQAIRFTETLATAQKRPPAWRQYLRFRFCRFSRVTLAIDSQSRPAGNQPTKADEHCSRLFELANKRESTTKDRAATNRF